MNYLNFLKENKFWGKTIREFLSYIEEKSTKNWILIDTETTGLPQDSYEVQLTQVSCIVIKYNFDTNSYTEIDIFNKKIKLTDKTLSLMKDPGSKIKKVLSFNHYGGKYTFEKEDETLRSFYDFINKYKDSVFIIQNASFDMSYLNSRGSVKFSNEVIDTKNVLQLFYLPLLQKLSETDDNYKEFIKTIGTSSRDNGLISSSLSKIGPAFGLNMTNYHDAIVDCRLMIDMFIKIIQALKENKDTDISKFQQERIKSIRTN